MARLSKASSFVIWEDTGIPTPDGETVPSLPRTEDDVPIKSSLRFEEEKGEDRRSALISTNGHEETEDEDDADDERRESTYTTTTISSVPESTYRTDLEDATPTQPPYTPPIIRPSFRRPESVRRMQMSSPRQSLLSKPRSRTGTPRSARSATAKGSPRSKRRVSRDRLEDNQQPLPLVLLHVTLLPVGLPWSIESMQELLPQKTLENLHLLQSKVTEIMLQRGVLIPHPNDEYELLEERLLEVLELKKERFTKCGHFTHRDSRGSITSVDTARDSDSGLGSSVDGSDGELCETCEHHIKTADTAVGSGKRKWMIKVYASNGLMRASAWAAVWSEMESVDVEILPWISDEMRRKLDERRRKEIAEAKQRQNDEDRRIRELVDERVAREMQMALDGSQQAGSPRKRSEQPRLLETEPSDPIRRPETPFGRDVANRDSNDLPQIYRPSQVPLSLMVKNYIFLLAQDKRNVVMFCLTITIAWLIVMGSGANSKQDVVTTFNDACPRHEAPLVSLPETPSDSVAWEGAGDISDTVDMFEEIMETPVVGQSEAT
ncbi:uncharacterized protein LTR77_009802 [Saxophila tyrrhenica]|uniref:Pathway-specific nitrogen regulator n=1 Tax=Saxophila tyrrhenica TaxID=1690608 RepID=A0AAV9NY77_9PEZI|nr:hypothetical protein LTR77_009802 [Saxophila tyrrhenica]